MGTNKTYIKYNKLLEEKATGIPWTESEIIYFRKYINTRNLDSDLIPKFYRCMPENGYQLTAAQDQKGTNYLLNNSIKKNGQLRKGSKLDSHEINILLNSPTNTFIGLQDLNTMKYGFTQYVAVYRMTDKDGRWFEYTGVTYSMLEVISYGKNNDRPKLKLVS